MESHHEWLARVHPEDRDRAERSLMISLNGNGSAYESEYRIIRPSDGEVRWIHARADIERNAEGKAVRLVGAHLDVTEQKRMQASVRESEERFRALVTAGTYSIFRMSPDWRVMYQLDSQTLDQTAEPIENWVEKYIPPEDLAMVSAVIDQAIRTKSLFELEHRVWLANGEIGWAISRAVPLLGPAGRSPNGSEQGATSPSVTAMRRPCTTAMNGCAACLTGWAKALAC